MTTEQLFEAFRILKAKGAEEFGIHAFLASNTVTNEYYPMLARVLFKLAVQLRKETGAHISFINLSGGIGIPYTPDQEPNDIRVIGDGAVSYTHLPIFKFSATVRKVIYTTNAIESLNSTYRKLNRQRSVFPSDTALLKALYLATFEATKKWTATIRNWAQVYGELSIMYEGRLPE